MMGGKWKEKGSQRLAGESIYEKRGKRDKKMKLAKVVLWLHTRSRIQVGLKKNGFNWKIFSNRGHFKNSISFSFSSNRFCSL